MRNVPKKSTKKNKATFAFVIILILVTIFSASFIISYNVMSEKNFSQQGGLSDNVISDDYEEPKDMLDGNLSKSEQIKKLKEEINELKSTISKLTDENDQLRAELNTLTAALENQSFVSENASSSDGTSSSSGSDNNAPVLNNISETGL